MRPPPRVPKPEGRSLAFVVSLVLHGLAIATLGVIRQGPAMRRLLSDGLIDVSMSQNAPAPEVVPEKQPERDVIPPPEEPPPVDPETGSAAAFDDPLWELAKMDEPVTAIPPASISVFDPTHGAPGRIGPRTRGRGIAGGSQGTGTGTGNALGSGSAPTPVVVPPPPPPVVAPPPPPPQAEPVRTAARALHAPAPPYPASAKESGIEGVVRLIAEVLADGNVGEVEVEEPSGSAHLDDAAVRAVKKWKFEPARVDGVAVTSRVRLPPIRFRIRR